MFAVLQHSITLINTYYGLLYRVNIIVECRNLFWTSGCSQDVKRKNAFTILSRKHTSSSFKNENPCLYHVFLLGAKPLSLIIHVGINIIFIATGWSIVNLKIVVFAQSVQNSFIAFEDFSNRVEVINYILLTARQLLNQFFIQMTRNF